MLLEFSANPREPVPSPDSPIIRFAEAVDPASAFETPRYVFRRLMRFLKNVDYLRWKVNEVKEIDKVMEVKDLER